MTTYSRDPRYEYNRDCKDFLMVKIPTTIFKTNKDSMEVRVSAFKKQEGHLPGFIHITPNNPEFLSISKFLELEARFYNYYDTHEQTFPDYIWINKPINPIPIDPKPTPPPLTNKFIESFELALRGKFTTFTQMYNLVKGRIYSHYNNDVYPQGKAVQRLLNNEGLNCADFSQLGYAVAKILGYTVRYVHIKCSSGTGHVYLQVKGKELGNNWVNADLAAAASNGSNYSLGRIWCPNHSLVGYNPAWLTSGS